MGSRDKAFLRACELANGRAAMLGVVGWIWPQVFGLWAGGSVTTTDPFEAIGQVPTVAWVQIIFLCGAIEAGKLNYNNRHNAPGHPLDPPAHDVSMAGVLRGRSECERRAGAALLGGARR